MKARDINIILCILAVGILIAGYYLLYSPAKDDEKRLVSEINSLQQRYDDLKAKEAHKDEYLAETKKLKEEFDAEVLKYAPDLDQENAVMWFRDAEETFDTLVNKSVSMPHPEEFYTLGAGASSTSSLEGAEQQASQDYVCSKVKYGVAFEGSYEQLKDYLDYVLAYKYRMNIDSINMTYMPAEELVSGTLMLNSYAITGPGREADVPDVDQPTGNDNIFIGGDSAIAPRQNNNKYSANSGEDIISTHDLVILLNSASNDAASGVIIASKESDESTYVTYEGNDVTDAELSVYAQDGKNFVDYKIGDKAYTTEIVSTDLTIYVKSSDRVGSDDTNGIKLSIVNTSTLPVYIKVVDDTNAQRFAIGNKSGIVTVY